MRKVLLPGIARPAAFSTSIGGRKTFAILRKRLIPLLAMAALSVSACANAVPANSASNSLSQELRAAAKRSSFPKFLTVEGQRYERLTGDALVHAIRGGALCPSPECSGIDGTVWTFREDGTFSVFGDRWDDGGEYAIVKDVVVMKLVDELIRYAFYRSADGTLRKAFEDSAGIVRSARLFTR